MTSAPARPLLRVGTLQALSFGMMGAVYPFLALELRAAGVGGVLLVVALIAAPTIRLFGGPLWGSISDTLGDLRSPLLLAGGLSVLGVLAIGLLPGPAVVAGAVLLAVGRAGAGPLVEAASLSAVDHDTGRYGTVRRWGSLGFLLCVLVAALARDHLGLTPLLLASLVGAAMVIVAVGLPRGRRPERSRPSLAPLLGDPLTWLVLATSALHFAGISLYDSFFAVHLEELDLGTTWLGVAIVLGIGTELLTLSLGSLLLRRLDAPWLLLLAIAVQLPRWALTAVGTTPWLLVPVQVVHGFTFGAYWLACIAILSARAPRELTGSTQGLLAASAGGVGALLANLLGSLIVEHSSTSNLFWTALGLTALAGVSAVGVAVVGRGAGNGSAAR